MTHVGGKILTGKTCQSRRTRRQIRGRLRAWLRRWLRTDVPPAVGFALAAGGAGWLVGQLLVALFGGYAFAAGAVSVLTVVAVGAVLSLVWAERRQRAYSEALRVKVAIDLGAFLAEEDALIRERTRGRQPLRVVGTWPVESSR